MQVIPRQRNGKKKNKGGAINQIITPSKAIVKFQYGMPSVINGNYKTVTLQFNTPWLEQATDSGGAFAKAIAIEPTSLVAGWSTRLGSLFREFVVIKVVSEINMNFGSNNAFIVAWYDEKDSNVPTGAEAAFSPTLRLLSNSANFQSLGRVSLRVTDFLDLQFTTTAGTKTVAYLKLYGDTASNITGNTVEVCTVRHIFTIMFRGYV